MTISKHIHSCLLIKDQGKAVLVDPGIYSYDEKALDLSTVEALDYIAITHEHPDHMYVPFIKEVLEKFPAVQIISNESAVALLAKEGIATSSSATDDVALKVAPHEKVFDIVAPMNVVFTVFNKVTHPGDSLQSGHSAEILALPIQAGWGSLTQSVEYALTLRPKYVIPIHDWQLNDKARNGIYDRLQKYFGENGIEFKPLKTGEEVSF